MQTSMNVVLLILIPATIAMIILSGPAVMFAYQRGAFGDRAAWMTQTALMAYSVGLIGAGVKALLIRIFYALQDTKTPMINSFYDLIFNIILNVIFVRFLGHNGLALATSLSTTFTAVILLYELRKKIGNLGLEKMIQSSIKIAVSSVIMGVVVYVFYNYSMALFDPNRLFELIILMITVLIGFSLYLLLLYLFKVDEFHFLMNSLKNKLKKN